MNTITKIDGDMVINREIKERVEASLFKGKAVIIYGARRTGKTTLIKQIQLKFPGSAYLNCDEPSVREALTDKGSLELKNYLGNHKLVFLDEAQRVRNIGLSLKLLVDNFPQMQIVATGSSSFELSNQIVEPLTGRKREFYLFPLSWRELGTVYDRNTLDALLEQRLIFGMYPEVVFQDQKNLEEIVRSYLYKDVLQYQEIKNPDILEKLLQAIALQLGQEVSYNELAGLVQIDKNTVRRYLEILEKAFVIFRLKAFSRNRRKEISQLRKIYFYDNGVRNALIGNLNRLNLRQDRGALWENFLIAERIKLLKNKNETVSQFFWRNYQQAEIDYLEERAGKLSGFEFKWKEKRYKIPKAFADLCPQATAELIHRNNYQKFI